MDYYSTLILFIIFCLTYITLSYMRIFKEKATLPPGPIPLPFLGNLLQINTNDIASSLMKLRDKYGPVYTLYLGPKPGLVICGYKAVKEALIDQNEEFSERGDYPIFLNFIGEHDLAFTNGEKWKDLRRFALLTLRNFGMGKRSVEERILEEAQFLIKEFQGTKGSAVNPTNYLSNAVSNIICSIVFGNRFDYQDKRLFAITQSINNNFRIMSSTWGTLYNMFPDVMEYLPGPHQKMRKYFQDIYEISHEFIEHHEKTLDPNNPRDYIDCFLLKIREEKDNSKSAFHTKSLLRSIQNLLFGGTETVSTTLRYSILVLMKYPEVAGIGLNSVSVEFAGEWETKDVPFYILETPRLVNLGHCVLNSLQSDIERVQEEIDRVIGRHRSPSIAERNKMPYTDATLHELTRFCDVLPSSLPRQTSKDVMYRGYLIPKATYVTPLLTSVHYDPEYFAEPNKFNPNNFLDEKGLFKKNDAHMPFAVGKRSCLGESLARMELFLLFTSLLQNFTFKPVIGKDEIDLRPTGSGLGNLPSVYKCFILPR